MANSCALATTADASTAMQSNFLLLHGLFPLSMLVLHDFLQDKFNLQNDPLYIETSMSLKAEPDFGFLQNPAPLPASSLAPLSTGSIPKEWWCYWNSFMHLSISHITYTCKDTVCISFCLHITCCLSFILIWYISQFCTANIFPKQTFSMTEDHFLSSMVCSSNGRFRCHDAIAPRWHLTVWSLSRSKICAAGIAFRVSEDP